MTALALAGCTPGVSGSIGISRIGEELRAVLVTCPNHELAELTLRDRLQINAKREFEIVERWSLEAPVDQVATGSIGTITEFAERLSDDVDYSVSGFAPAGWGWGANGPIFTEADVLELGDGKVLGHPFFGYEETSVYASVDAFRSSVLDEGCGIEPSSGANSS